MWLVVSVYNILECVNHWIKWVHCISLSLFQCTGAFCQDAAVNQTQRFEVSQTVSFIDVSQPATKFKGEAPIFIAKLPSDFFYPFLFYTGAANSFNSVSVLVTVLSLVTSLLSGSMLMFSWWISKDFVGKCDTLYFVSFIDILSDSVLISLSVFKEGQVWSPKHPYCCLFSETLLWLATD